MTALDWIITRYHVWYIWISVYNSQSNEVVKTTHRTVQDTFVKMCEENVKRWQEYVLYVFWTD